MDSKILFVLFFILSLGYSAYTGYQKQRDTEQGIRQRCTLRITGIIDKMDNGTYYNGMRWSKMGGRKSYVHSYTAHRYMIYCYKVDGREFAGMDSRMALSFIKAGKPGSEAVLYVNPKNPDEFYTPGEDRNVMLTRGIFPAVFLFFTVIILIFFL